MSVSLKIEYSKGKRMKILILNAFFMFAVSAFSKTILDSPSPIIIQEQITFKQKEFVSLRINAIKTIKNDSVYLKFNKETIQNIFDFKIYYDKKTVSVSALKTLNVFESNYNYITYKVRFSEITNQSFLPTANFNNKDYALLSFNKILGDFTNLENYKIELSIKKNDDLVYLKTENFKYFSLESFCLACQNIILQDKFLSLNITTNKNDIIKNNDLIRLIYQAIFSVQKIENFKFNQPKEMIFIFDSISNNTGAITKKNQIIFYFNSYDEYLIAKTITHEILHWFIPKQYSWLDESFIEYFAIKSMLQAGLISKRNFLTILSNKMNMASKFENISVEDLYIKGNYNALYSKGAFYAFLLDLHLLKNSNRKVSLEKYLLNPKSFSENTNEMGMFFIDFMNDYIINNKRKAVNSFVNALGILYEENKLKEVKQAALIKIVKQEQVAVITDDANIEGFNIGDTIYSLNGKTKYNEILNDLVSSNSKQMVFVIKNNKEKQVIKLDNKSSVMIKLKNNFSFYDKMSEIQKYNWDNYVNSTF